SRRRHTRFSRDWSSDVCSSDLIGSTLRAPESFWLEPEVCSLSPVLRTPPSLAPLTACSRAGWTIRTVRRSVGPNTSPFRGLRDRSEERRVGKEGRGEGREWE